MDAMRTILEHPDYVHGLLIMSELGLSDTKIAYRVHSNRPRITELLSVAREASAWKTTTKERAKTL